MKTINQKLFRLVVGSALAYYLFSFTQKTFAIEGLSIAVPSTNAVLSWPSDSSETYIIQYRHTLDATDSWSTLADYYPADSSTNITHYIDTNPLDYGSGGSGGGSFSMSMSSSGSSSSRMSSSSEMSCKDILALLMPPNLSGNSESLMSSEIQSADSPTLDGAGGSSSSIAGSGFYRVVRDGIHLIGITNNMVLSGVVTIPIELGNASGQITTISVSENETPIGNSLQFIPVAHPQFLKLNTTLMANGVHGIYGSARWDDTNGGLWEAESPVISVTVSNEISFENWMPTYGELDNTLLFRATSAHPDTDWIVRVYNQTNGYLGYFSGHTYDGDISIYWDFNGYSYTNIPSFSFEVETEYIDPPSPPTYKVTDPWTATGAWAMALQHAWDSSLDTASLYQQLNGFVAFGGNHGGVYPPKNSSDDSPYTLAFDDPAANANWAAFRSAIYNPICRNFVYFGHGGQVGIGYNTFNTNRFITATEIANRLHTIPAGQTNRHAYRFDFIDACSTALGTLPESFGILHRENVPASDYIASSTRFSTYVGWPQDKVIGLINGRYPNYDHIHFMEWIQYELIGNQRTIKDAIIHASHNPNVHGFGENDLKVFGYWDLQIGTFNN